MSTQIQITPASGITVGATSVTSGTVGRVFFQGTGNVVQQSSSLFWDNTNLRLGVGASPASTVRLDVRAQGTLSTDIAFRVRNSANTADIFNIKGNGVSMPWADNFIFEYGLNAASNFGATITKNGQFGTHFRIHQFGGGVATSISEAGFIGGKIALGVLALQNYRISTFNGFGSEVDHISLSQGQNATKKASIVFKTNYQAGVSYNTARLQVETYNANSLDRTKFNFWATNGGPLITPLIVGSLTCKSNFLIGTPTEDINDSSTIYLPNGTAPTASITDGYKQYSDDIVAGNAAPHFRTENGSIIKLYQETTAVTASAFVSNTSLIVDDSATYGGYTMGQVVAALKAQGLLA